MKTIKTNRPRPLLLRIIDTLIESLSVVIFPFIFASKFKINPLPGYLYVVAFIALIYIYKDVFLPRNPNKYFDMLFVGIFLILSILFSIQSGNLLITALVIMQLLLFISTKLIKDTTPLLTDVIFNFVTPVFLMITLTYSLAKFLSLELIISILLINTFSLTVNYLDFNYKSLFGLTAVLLLAIIMYITQYITLANALSMFATMLFFVLIKYFYQVKINSCWVRILISLLQIF